MASAVGALLQPMVPTLASAVVSACATVIVRVVGTVSS
jgi:hypothetical protein